MELPHRSNFDLHSDTLETARRVLEWSDANGEHVTRVVNLGNRRALIRVRTAAACRPAFVCCRAAQKTSRSRARARWPRVTYRLSARWI